MTDKEQAMWSISNRSRSTKMTVMAALFGLHLLAPGIVQGQGEAGLARSTVDRRTALREAKMNDLESPVQTAVEAGLNWMETTKLVQRLRHGWKGFHPVLGGFPSGSGQAFGIEWRKVGLGTRYPSETSANRVDLMATGAASLRGYYLLKTETALRNVFSRPLNVSGVMAYRRNAQEDFYGFGQDSLAENRTNYLLEAAGVGGVLWWREPTWLSIGGAMGWVDFNVGPGTDRRHPVTERVFAVDRIPGLVEQGAFIRSDAFIEIDWRNQGNPYRGGFYGFRWSDWRDQDLDAFSFNQYEIDLQQYLPLAGGTRVIALRARSVLSDADDGQQVPFYLMPTLGGNKELRGFDYARFTDLNSILFQLEYRAEVWMAMDLALFIDAGRVAADRGDLLDHLEVNYGFGLRLKTADSTFLRADFAFGGESFRTAITFDNVFDDLPLYRSVAKQR
jgi:hypothetical protein